MTKFEFARMYLIFKITTVTNFIIPLTDILYHLCNVANNAALPEFSWKELDMKDGNKRPLEDCNPCKAVKGKHERSTFLTVGWIKLHSCELELIYAGYLPRCRKFRKLILTFIMPL